MTEFLCKLAHRLIIKAFALLKSLKMFYPPHNASKGCGLLGAKCQRLKDYKI